MYICPICRSTRLKPRITASEIAQEVRFREQFVRSRFDYLPSRMELIDLTEFMHGGDGMLAACAGCGLTLRVEDRAARYEEDVYDSGLLQVLYPRYLRTFQGKHDQCRPLLPARAEVLEVGSHLGAFLQTAEEWDWRPRGFDIGEQTSHFARRRGLSVRRECIEDARLSARCADGVFIWNCFEQLPDPRRTLEACYRLVRPGGLLAVRTPNVEFYRTMRPGMRRARASAIRTLTHNNLLGFPYLAGYDPRQLCSLLNQHGFRPVAGYDSTLLTVPYPEVPSRLKREIAATQSAFRDSIAMDAHLLTAPWMEIVCRRVD